jgi:hypothetical protein
MYGLISRWLVRRQVRRGQAPGTPIVVVLISGRTGYEVDVLDRAACCSCRREI